VTHSNNCDIINNRDNMIKSKYAKNRDVFMLQVMMTKKSQARGPPPDRPLALEEKAGRAGFVLR
jgi:hypothetical protein